MTSDALLSLAADVVPPRLTQANYAMQQKPLTVAVVNNMPDAALRATERQFCSLLDSASTGLLVQLKFYTLPGVQRSDRAQAHIDAFYEDFHAIKDDPPDGLIMTGAEPGAGSLKDEAFWPSMAYAINFCHDNGIPAIWSCLAAHAAIFEIDGIPRIRLPRKLSGAFDCGIETSKHQIFHRMPKKWCVPHSRLNGIRRADLERNGYDVVSASGEAGVDMFIKRCECIQLFLQGHPEYEPDTLAAEYRRDVLRAASGQSPRMPEFPRGLGERLGRTTAQKLTRIVREGNEADLHIYLDAITRQLKTEPSWAFGARKLYENWLAYVDARKTRVNETTSVQAHRQRPDVAMPATQQTRIREFSFENL